MEPEYVIRNAKLEDLESIVNIYNFAVLSKFETADTIQLNWRKRMGWFKNHKPDKYPIFVFENNREIVGWISLSPYRKGRKALKFTLEISYYVHPKFKRRGFGSKMIEHAILESRKLNCKTLVAIILDKNEGSINLLTKYGFNKWGHLPNIADFNGIECGHVYFGLRLSN